MDEEYIVVFDNGGWVLMRQWAGAGYGWEWRGDYPTFEAAVMAASLESGRRVQIDLTVPR